MTRIPFATLRPVAELQDRVDLSGGFFYTTSKTGWVSLWHADKGANTAILLGQRHPGTSGKDAATIARNLLAGA